MRVGPRYGILRQERNGELSFLCQGKEMIGKEKYGRQGGVWNGFAKKGSEWQAGNGLLRREWTVLARSGRHGGVRKFQVSRGTKRSVPVRQARLALVCCVLDRRCAARHGKFKKEEINLVYQFKLPGLYPVSAQTAGEELHRIYTDKGQLKPADIVDESRPTSAPLHPCFEWDDEVAAEKYREVQAGNLIRSITVVHETPTHEPVEVRAFVKPLETYAPIEVVVNSEEQMAALLESALSELKSFEKKYATLSKLYPIFEEIKKLTK